MYLLLLKNKGGENTGDFWAANSQDKFQSSLWTRERMKKRGSWASAISLRLR